MFSQLFVVLSSDFEYYLLAHDLDLDLSGLLVLATVLL